jgi:hypothetical protein
LEQRVLYVEQQVGSSADDYSRHFEDLQALSSRLSDFETTSKTEADERHVTLEQRVELIETKLLASNYSKEMDLAEKMAEDQKKLRSKVDCLAKDIQLTGGPDNGRRSGVGADHTRFSTPGAAGNAYEHTKFDTHQVASVKADMAKISSRLGQTPPATPPVSTNTKGSAFGSAPPSGGRLGSAGCGDAKAHSTLGGGPPATPPFGTSTKGSGFGSGPASGGGLGSAGCGDAKAHSTLGSGPAFGSTARGAGGRDFGGIGQEPTTHSALPAAAPPTTSGLNARFSPPAASALPADTKHAFGTHSKV